MPYNAKQAAGVLKRRGWKVEPATLFDRKGRAVEGWRWTSPEGQPFEVAGPWEKGPVGPRSVKRQADWHIRFRKVSPRNVQFVAKSLPVPCPVPGCGRVVAEALLLEYRGVKCCPACFERQKAEVERGLYRRETFVARARAYMEQQAQLGRQNAPEVCP